MSFSPSLMGRRVQGRELRNIFAWAPSWLSAALLGLGKAMFLLKIRNVIDKLAVPLEFVEQLVRKGYWFSVFNIPRGISLDRTFATLEVPTRQYCLMADRPPLLLQECL